MKRNYVQLEQSASASEHEDNDDEQQAPPARKILKNLLQNEVNKALRDLHADNPTLHRPREHRAASLIPEFDPESDDCTVQSWIKKIDQLGEIHGWDDTTKSFHLQDKLRGQAKKWYNRLEDYNYSWVEWKRMLLHAFPKHRDYGSMLEELLQRRKSPTETMTKYYQDKVAMCFRCKLPDSASVSCIIRGLPQFLQPNARAFQCQTPGELYEGFLCALDDYRTATTQDSKLIRNTSTRPSFDKKFIVANPETDPCPRCKKTGHLLRDCTQPDTRKCFKCGTQGHIALRCPNQKETSAENIKAVNVLRSYNDTYKKVAKVNGVHVRAYIDSGSQVNVLNEHVSRGLDLQVKPTNVILKGFSGDLILSQGEVHFNLEVDDITIQCQAYLSDIKMKEIKEDGHISMGSGTGSNRNE